MELALCSADEAASLALRQMLRQWLSLINARVEIIQYAGQEKLFYDYASGRFVFVFLDTEPDGLETARRLRLAGDKCQIVFFSSRRKQALACYSVHPAGFFLKPVQQGPLYDLMWWYRSLFLPSMQYLTVLSSRTERKLLLADIHYIAVSGRVSLIHMTEEIIRTNRTLSDLALQLAQAGFFRCHRGYLVNSVHVLELRERKLLMENGASLPVSEDRLSETHRCLQMLKAGRRS